MNPQSNHEQVQQHLGMINSTLDELIRCQRLEQEIILNRQADQLPDVCTRIGNLTSLLYQKQASLQQICQNIPEQFRSMATECRNKFSLLQELAVQNHLLLENNLKYLDGVFQAVFGANEPKDIYNPFGLMRSSGRPVSKSQLIEVKV